MTFIAEKSITPLMKQYWEVKALHSDKILLFRMGDFFEMFYDDAITAAPILGIALTSRNKKAADETPMCGVPHHSIAGHIHKLLQAGFRVAICDQIEDAKFAKGLVRRAVTRILSPGMVYDSDTLDSGTANYIAAYDDGIVAFADPSSGEAFFVKSSENQLEKTLELFPVVELVLATEQLSRFQSQSHWLRSNFDEMATGDEPRATRRLLAYIKTMGGESALKPMQSFKEKLQAGRMWLSPTTIRHLEIFSTYDGENSGSLVSAIDRTSTSGGRRRLKQWLSFPLRDLNEILTRQKRVQIWLGDLARLKRFRDLLGGVGDLERRNGKMGAAQCNARDLVSLAQSMSSAGQALQLIGEENSLLLSLSSKISSTLREDPPLTVRQGFMIREGVSKDLDQWIKLSTQSQALLQELEEREKKSTGINSLKIRYNNVFGYYIEITNTHREKTPSRYIRKQTLANAERFVTEELLELEQKISSAQVKRFDLEYAIFDSLKNETLGLSVKIGELASYISELDVESSLAWLALERNYVMPTVGAKDLAITSSRHPVLEQISKARFVPNDILLSKGGGILLTGPNMAGKSTLMRQVALTAIMAQIGAPVPAKSCQMPIFDSIWTRIGASDQLSKGLSTFMVEMNETSEMLRHATENSLVILDEVGRGTSTYDGLSLAQAILENLLREKRSFVLFATHYHELTKLPEHFKELRNLHMRIAETDELQFLYTLSEGPAKKSYGIRVAGLAGLPSSVIRRAEALLTDFESKALRAGVSTAKSRTDSQMDLFSVN